MVKAIVPVLLPSPMVRLVMALTLGASFKFATLIVKLRSANRPPASVDRTVTW